MKIEHKTTNLNRAGDVEIPQEFFNRLKTGIAQVDRIFGEGILPGMTFTISADPGCGKTTLMLQICQALANQGYSAAYLSGEESQVMVAYTCRRLKTVDVLIANNNDISCIEDIAEQVDLLIIDSFQSLHCEADSKSAAEQAKADALVTIAKNHKTAIGIIMHSTKGGTYKGGSGVVHAVDCNMRLSADGDNVRTIEVDKNRYGSAGAFTFFFGSMGYDFEKAVEVSDQTQGKGSNKVKQLNAIMQMTEPPCINVERVCKDLHIDEFRANYLLRQLVSEDKLQKFGRAENAVWKFVEVTV
jgi:predicted ATP-dependent serine protease